MPLYVNRTLNLLKARVFRILPDALPFTRHHWQVVNFGLGLLTAALIVLAGSSGFGQNVVPPHLQVPKLEAPKLEAPKPPVPSVASATPAIATADVKLDGRTLFTIAAPNVTTQAGTQSAGTPPIKERVKNIEETLNRIAKNTAEPKTLDVKAAVDEQSRLPVISIGTRYLMTVTTLDAQLQAQDPEQRATELIQIIRDALTVARQERQPQSLMRQGSVAGQLALGIVAVSGILALVQRWIKAQREQLVAQAHAAIESSTVVDPTSTAAMAIVREQIKQRRQRSLNDVQRRLLQVMQLSIWLGGLFIILGLFPYTRWLQSLILSGPLKILGIVIAVYLLIRVSDTFIDRFFNALTANELLPPDTSQRLAQRITTFSRVLRSLVATVWISTGILTSLSIVGVELGPVLAGAGILGLALSLASQNLIKDVINGLLILWEDQYAVGDVIQIGKATGLVESLNLRITQLRNSEGRLITIPNSSITVVENLSKDWSRVDLGITIAYDANVDRAITVVKQVGEDMTNDLAWKDKIPEPPDVLGVDDIGNNGITLRVWIKTLPLQQWNVAREFRRRLKRSLDDEGIAIGLPQQSLWFRNSSDPPHVADGKLPSPHNAVNDEQD
ncbi:mechanosensitive ion channel family protein [Leptolyngbya sp. FACHB-321]|uniref:mechanosensitive ion channel family protein n=1 Tax=Leptolyngbya sp. FACHB-321 TaxID=2692807 RepID=UPI001686CE30|nr:mechanosensitive ion channel family protein [Leptolyngbya sp. FACHB-321]MBD2035723.1 mechanosensitive ion channel family protein [Leptolyngbya sp. FACHB-321]